MIYVSNKVFFINNYGIFYNYNLFRFISHWFIL